jgi:hypothetical protein
MSLGATTEPAQDSRPKLVPSVVEGRVVDDSGEGVPNVDLMLTDTAHLSGYVDPQGCGTYHPQEHVTSGPDGRFHAQLPFTPTEASVEFTPEDFASRPEWIPVAPGQEVKVTVRRIHWRTYEGQVVDDQGAPLAQVRIEPGGSTNDTGHFQLKLDPERQPGSFRFRKMGFKPLVLPGEPPERVMLRERRTFVTVKLVDAKTKQPVGGLNRISAYHGEELLSFCTAGDMATTHEAAEGQCVLDADPGLVQLRLEQKPVRTLKVSTAPQEVTIPVKP